MMMPRLKRIVDRDLNPGAMWRVVAGAAFVTLIVVLIMAGFGHLMSGRYENVLASAAIAAISVVGYQIFVGSTGIVSFGHPAFIAIGAYVSGILTIPAEMKEQLLPDLPSVLQGVTLGPVSATIAAGVCAALVAVVIGPVVMRLTGAAAGVMTFGMLVIANEVIRNAESFTRGTQTFFGVPQTVDSWHASLVLIAVVAVAVAFKFLPIGLRARAMGEDPLAAEMSGIGVVRARLWAWTLSAAICGISGAMLAENLTAFSPNSFYVNMVIPMLLMLVLGGTRSVIGAVFGTLAISVWQELMRALEGAAVPGTSWHVPVGISDLTLGVALVLLLYLRPSGLMKNTEFELTLGAAARR